MVMIVFIGKDIRIPYTNKLNAQRTVGKNNIGAPKIRINFAIAIC